jgi:hypothetical protein
MNTSVTSMGFALFDLKTDTDQSAFLAQFLIWRRDFMMKQKGVRAHWLFKNLEGGYADMVLADTQEDLQAMVQAFSTDAVSRDFEEMIDHDSVKMAPGGFPIAITDIPEDFSAIEVGTFTATGTDDQVLAASQKCVDQYLQGLNPWVATHMIKHGDQAFSELSFFKTLAEAMEICQGYNESEACADLLALCEPTSVNIGFWLRLA